MECIPTIVSETIGEETTYLERHEDFKEKNFSTKRMTRTKRTLNQGQYEVFIQQGLKSTITFLKIDTREETRLTEMLD